MQISQFIIDYEVPLRLGAFFLVFLIMAMFELLWPRRKADIPKIRRWRANLGLVAINTIVLRVLFPTAAVGVAIKVESMGWGLFGSVPAPQWIAVLSSILALDLVIYFQHILMHKIPVLWRLHRVHHVDLDFDVTTGARFHPLEIVISMLIKFAAIMVLGAPVLAVIMFEVLLNATAMFNHSNVRLSGNFDRLLRLFLVTPDMHRVHHSIVRSETDSNFGFNAPWWDRLFGTYQAQPTGGHVAMQIGQPDIRDEALCVNLVGMLKLPFISNKVDPSR